MTNRLERVGIILLGFALVGLLAYWVFSTSFTAYGSAPSGLPAGRASSSQIAVTAGTVAVPVATSSVCAARIISTASTSIMVSIGEAFPSATLGYWQNASTTEKYDGGLYGCGAVKIYPFSTGAITVTEAQ